MSAKIGKNQVGELVGELKSERVKEKVDSKIFTSNQRFIFPSGIIFFVNNEAKIEFVSDNVTQGLGFKQDDLLGKSLFRWVFLPIAHLYYPHPSLFLRCANPLSTECTI